MSPSLAYDVALVAAIGVISALTLVAGGDPDVTGPEIADYPRGLAIALAVATVVPLVVRRRYPVAVLLVVTAGLTALHLLEIPEFNGSSVAFYVAMYSVGAYGTSRPSRQWSRALAGLDIALLLVWEVWRTADQAPDANLTILTALTAALNVVYFAAAWYMGDLVRNRRRRQAELEAVNEELRMAQAERARQAVLGERLRIARELHDVLAHHVSVMGVQAGAARRVLDTRPDEVPALLGSIEASSREAVAELQRMLGLLREEGASAAGVVGGPQPGVARLPELVGDMNQAGLVVDLVADPVDAIGALPSAVDLSAYRIVQEALTNTLKHAGPGTRVDVRLRRSDAALEVIVEDDGAMSGQHTGDGTGNGIIGMRERVALSGGELRTGPRLHGRGWEVRAWFPT